MTDAQRTIRASIRAFLLIATQDELERELALSLDMGDTFRAACIRELMNEE